MAWRLELVESELDATARLVGLTLDTFMSAGGVCFPSRAAIAHRSGLDVRTVERATRRLERAGLLRVERGGGRTCSRYYALIPSDRGQPSTPAAQRRPRGGAAPPQGRHSAARNLPLNLPENLPVDPGYESVHNGNGDDLAGELARRIALPP
jgi:DNA-binding transcriptional ArsR family regulator